MSLLRNLNRKLGTTIGYEIRRAPADRTRSAVVTTQEPGTKLGGGAKPPEVAFRPPEDPAVDRLLRRPVFIMCPVRSGSTLLRLLLNAHSELHSPHELHVRRLEVRCSTKLAEQSMEALGLDRGDLEHLLWDRVMHRELVKAGKSTIVEKTPSNAFVYQRIAACWPDARFIFLLRHPASIAKSWYEASPDTRDPEVAMFDSLRYMRAVERARKGLTGHTVRYEELTEDPESALKRICSFLEVDWEPAMLDYGSKTGGELQKGLGDWKDKIRSGRVQPGRSLPEREEIPEPLRQISEAWGYLGSRQDAPHRARSHAELAQVWPRDGQLRLTGDIHGEVTAVPAESWRLELTLRGQQEHEPRTYPASLNGTRFDATVPVADLAPPGLPVPARWDIHLTADTAEGQVRLRAGRHLDDITDKKKIMVFPAQSVGDGADTVLVKPYYTIKNNLSIECYGQADNEEHRAP